MGRLYYDPAMFDEEMKKIWHRHWVYVGHESEVPQPGDYLTRQIGL
jgi:phenylpropionate dioxygenase-like ring-hydroxylating dioxygenase large terminal subunit